MKAPQKGKFVGLSASSNDLEAQPAHVPFHNPRLAVADYPRGNGVCSRHFGIVRCALAGDEAARYRALSDYRLQQFEFLFDEWQKQKPKTIKHTHTGKYIIDMDDGRAVTLKP
jgi:hypothetical protein